MQPSDPNLPVEQKMANALRVLILDPKTQAWLMDNDPMALKQARDAVREYEAKRLCSNCGQDLLTGPQCLNMPGE
jgi:hypothetical protein